MNTSRACTYGFWALVQIIALLSAGAAESIAENNLIVNPSFEEREPVTGQPLGWIVTAPAQIDNGQDNKVQARDGQHALRLRTLEDVSGIVVQSMHLTAADLGKKLSVWAWGMAPVGNLIYLAIRCTVKGNEETLVFEPWPACPDEWTPKRLVVTIPPEADPASVQVFVYVKRRAGLKCALDAVIARVDGRVAHALAAATETSENLIANGSLESKDQAGRPRGWIVSPIEMVVNGVQGDAQDASDRLLLNSVPQWGVVAFNLPAHAITPGRTVTGNAYGKCPAEDEMFLGIRCKVADKSIELARVPWPTTPDWLPLQVKAIIPAGVDPASVQLVVSIKPGTGHTFELDHLSATCR